MKQIKVFKFRVSNASSSVFEDDKKQSWYIKKQNELDNQNTIEDVVNNFCKNHNVIDITTSTIDVNYHNNGRGNTVDLIYTIIYED